MEHPAKKFSIPSGFTLIELLIIISIMSILASIMFGSQYSIREQVYLFQDQYKVIDLINKAKNLTLAAYMRDPSVCGYGVSFENNNGVSEVILFKDKKEIVPDPVNNIQGTDCNSAQHSHEYNPDAPSFDEKISESSFTLNPMDSFSDPGDGHKIAMTFNAPALSVFLTKDGGNIPDTIGNVSVLFKSQKSNIPVSINVNKFGEIKVGNEENQESSVNN